MGFHQAIQDTEQRINKLHSKVHETYRLRTRSEKHKQNWSNAAANFREYVSPIDQLMQKCETDDIDSSETLREFCIDFLEVNPIFFRSGYFKENILGKLKKIDHTQNEIKRLQAILIDAVLHRGQREYKKYCRLASVVADYAFIKDLTELTWHEDPAVKSRATLMLNLVKQSS